MTWRRRRRPSKCCIALPLTTWESCRELLCSTPLLRELHGRLIAISPKFHPNAPRKLLKLLALRFGYAPLAGMCSTRNLGRLQGADSAAWVREHVRNMRNVRPNCTQAPLGRNPAILRPSGHSSFHNCSFAIPIQHSRCRLSSRQMRAYTILISDG